MGDLVLSNARLLDGRGGTLERATVRLSAGRVAEILPGVAAKKGWAGQEVVDLSGATLMPALVDAHVHLSSYPTLPSPLRGEEPRTPALRYFELANFARDLVSMGVLTVRDVGSEGDHARGGIGLAARGTVRRFSEQKAYGYISPDGKVGGRSSSTTRAWRAAGSGAWRKAIG